MQHSHSRWAELNNHFSRMAQIFASWAGHPAMFLLAIPATAALLQGWNDGTRFGTASVLEGAWTYTASRIMPIAAGLAVIGAIINFAFGRPAIRLIACAGAFLTVAAVWKLVVSMM